MSTEPSRGVHILAAIIYQIGAVLSAAVLVVGLLQFKDQYNQLLNGVLGGSATALAGIDYSIDIAYGLYVIVGGLALVLIGGILVLARGDRAAPVPFAATMPPFAQ